jgi:hypothetical protein
MMLTTAPLQLDTMIGKGRATWQVIAVKPLPKKAKTTAEWLAYIAIDMHRSGHSLKEIGKYIDSLPAIIKANKRRKKK